MIFETNGLISQSAYVKVTWFPEECFAFVLNGETQTVKDLMTSQTTTIDNRTVHLFTSIHKIQPHKGLYFFVTYQESIQEAQDFLVELIAKLNVSTEYLSQQCRIRNPDGTGIIVQQHQRRNTTLDQETIATPVTTTFTIDRPIRHSQYARPVRHAPHTLTNDTHRSHYRTKFKK